MKVEFDWRDYDDYAKWLQDVLTTLYEENEQLRVEKVKLLSENQQLKKQKDDVIEYIENTDDFDIEIFDESTGGCLGYDLSKGAKNILRMLGEIE